MGRQKERKKTNNKQKERPNGRIDRMKERLNGHTDRQTDRKTARLSLTDKKIDTLTDKQTE
jgi:hypothetical protein